MVALLQIVPMASKRLVDDIPNAMDDILHVSKLLHVSIHVPMDALVYGTILSKVLLNLGVHK